jgi:DNA topoisomerase-6 subunit B
MSRSNTRVPVANNSIANSSSSTTITASSTFSEISPSEFFYRNRDLAGFTNPSRALYMTIRELVENSLDACDLARILPEISVSIKAVDAYAPEPKQYTVTVKDNGPGIEPEYVPLAFGKVLFGTKFTLRQSRGMFGLGATMAILYGQITTNKPSVIRTIKDGIVYEYTLMLDIHANKPVIVSKSIYNSNNSESSNKATKHGLEVSITLVGDYTKAQQKIRDYIVQTALITPYADIIFEEPNGSILTFKRIMDNMPDPPTEVLPHPAGIDVETLRRLIIKDLSMISFAPKEKVMRELNIRDANIDLKEMIETAKVKWDNLTNAVKTTVSIIAMLKIPLDDVDKIRIDTIDVLREEIHYTKLLTNESNVAKISNVEPFKEHIVSIAKGARLDTFLARNFQRVGLSIAKRFLEFAGIDASKSIGMLSNDDIVKLVDAMHRYDGFLPPDATCLSPIGEKALESSIRSMFKPEFVAVVQRPASAYSGFPFIVEVGLAYGGEIAHKGLRVYRFANKIPLLYDEGSDVVWKVIDDIDWGRYKISVEEMPMIIVTHIYSTRIPYKTVGKEYVADRQEIEYELKNALRYLARKLSLHLSKKGSIAMAKKRLGLYSKYLPLLARFAKELSRAGREPRYKALLKLGEQYEEEYNNADDSVQ